MEWLWGKNKSMARQGYTAWMFTYPVVASVFILFGAELIEVFNTLGGWLGPHYFLPVSAPQETFFLVLTTAMMAMLTLTAFFQARDPSDLRFLALHLGSKFTSILFFLVFFIKTRGFAYLVGAIVDAQVALSVALLSLWPIPTRKQVLDGLARTISDQDPRIYQEDGPGAQAQFEAIDRSVETLPSLHRLVFFFGVDLMRVLGVGSRRLSHHEHVLLMRRWLESEFYPQRMLMKFLQSMVAPALFCREEVIREIGFMEAVEHRRKEARKATRPAYLSSRSAKDLASEYAKQTWDTIVIGSGAGGAVTAYELSKKGQKVLLLEEGRWYPQSERSDATPEVVYRAYRDRGVVTTAGMPLTILPIGRGVGGTTLINSGTCFRTPNEKLKEWRDHFGLSLFTQEQMDPLFAEVETEIKVAPVSDQVQSASSRLFSKGLAQLGYQAKPMARNASGCQGSGYCCYGCPTGAKQSTDISYLPRAIENGLKVLTDALVVDFLKEGSGGRKVTGVLARVEGQTFRFAAQSTVLSAGSLITPGLLRKIPALVKDARIRQHLGRHLTIHPASKVFALFDQDLKSWEGVPQGAYFDGLFQKGILLEGIFVPPEVAAMTVPFVGHEFSEFLLHYRKVASFGFMIEDTSEGHLVHLPKGPPLIRYDLSIKDAHRMRDAAAFLARIYLSQGAQEVIPLFRGSDRLRSLRDVERFEKRDFSPTDVEAMAFHPLCTARMASSPEQGVVGPDFRPFGTEGLYVCDGSVVPSALGVNPQVTIMTLAKLCAAQIAGRS